MLFIRNTSITECEGEQHKEMFYTGVNSVQLWAHCALWFMSLAGSQSKEVNFDVTARGRRYASPRIKPKVRQWWFLYVSWISSSSIDVSFCHRFCIRLALWDNKHLYKQRIRNLKNTIGIVTLYTEEINREESDEDGVDTNWQINRANKLNGRMNSAVNSWQFLSWTIVELNCVPVEF